MLTETNGKSEKGNENENGSPRLFSAGRDLLNEASAVADNCIRSALLAWAAGSLAEVVAALRNRVRRDLGRLKETAEVEGSGLSAGDDAGLLVCMLEAIAEDTLALREVVLLRKEAYRNLGEMSAVRFVIAEQTRFEGAYLESNADMLEALSLRAGYRNIDWVALMEAGKDVFKRPQ